MLYTKVITKRMGMNGKIDNNKIIQNNDEIKAEQERIKEINTKNKIILFYFIILTIYSSSPAAYVPITLPVISYIENNHPEQFDKIIDFLSIEQDIVDEEDKDKINDGDNDKEKEMKN